MKQPIFKKIMIAPNAFKESLSAIEVAEEIHKGFSSIFPDINFVSLPIADGGEGTIDCLIQHLGGTIYELEVKGPLGDKVPAKFGILKDNTAVIEMAQASGLALVPYHLRNPLKTTTFGSGELIRAALDKGCRKILVGLGNSATCDCGVGALAALGAQFKDSAGKDIALTGGGLQNLHSIDLSNLDPRLQVSEIIAAHDVDNVLLGKDGAIQYATQKGATLEQLHLLEKAFVNFDLVISRDLNKKIGNIAGTGAAGGLAAGLFACLNAELQSGIALIIEKIHLKQTIQGADLVITGEGQIDAQTIRGKAPIVIAKLAKSFKIPVIALAAKLGEGYDKVYSEGIDAVFSITSGPISREDCILQVKPLLNATAINLARLLSRFIIHEANL